VWRTSVDRTALEAGRQAYARRAWAEARELLAAEAAAGDLTADDLERLATSSYLCGHDRDSTDAWTAAYRARLDGDDPGGAVLCAFWLAFGLIQRGEMAEGGGWLARAEQLADERAVDGAGSGYLRVPRGLSSLERGDHAEAFGHFERAAAIARRWEDRDLLALSAIGQGQALCCLGRTAEGVARFDQAMVAVTSGELSPVVAGIVYCAVIDECQQMFDLARAFAWTAALSRWCDDQPGLVPYRGQCLVHRAQILRLHGAWHDAYEEAELARERLAEPPHPAIGMAHYELGELQRLRGELDEAAASYRRGGELGRSPHPGLALVLLAKGEIQDAVAAIDAAVAGAVDAVTRARQLPAFVDIMLSAGRAEDARRAADELRELAVDTDASYLRAAAAQATGAVAVVDGDPRAALASLRVALSLWSELEVPFEAARCRILVATACRSIGDSESARLELEWARRSLAQLGARTELDRHDWSPLAQTAVGDQTGPELTDREVQVLRRVVRGATNREVAAELFISVKTVERHLSVIFRKLDVPNRAAATAVALEAGLLPPE
jgi:DNA-binding CsgD family transcriptional regulator